jgi:hypothetical protein
MSFAFQDQSHHLYGPLFIGSVHKFITCFESKNSLLAMWNHTANARYKVNQYYHHLRIYLCCEKSQEYRPTGGIVLPGKE